MPAKYFVTALIVLLLYGLESSTFGEPKPDETLTLLGMLSEWQYPESKFHGANSSDAGVTGISSIKSQAILTTSDPAEKVLSFYLEKLNVNKEGRNVDENEGERITTEQSISVQDNSTDRNLNLYIISVVEGEISTTLVISRGEDEKETHIAWSQFRKLR